MKSALEAQAQCFKAARVSQPTTIPVVCALIVRDDRVLLARRPAGKHLALKWEFPGGKVEPGEDAEAALVREIKEELGCEIEVLRALPAHEHEYERGRIRLIPFLCRIAEGSAEPCAHEHDALAWARVEELMDYDLAPADVPVVRALDSELVESCSGKIMDADSES